MQEHFLKHQDQFYTELINKTDKKTLPLRPLFFAQHIHSQFVLLAFFLERDQEALGFLNDHLGITGLDSVLFVMKQPPWKSQDGDKRFWKARGVVAKLMDLIIRPLTCSACATNGVSLSDSARLPNLNTYIFTYPALKRWRN